MSSAEIIQSVRRGLPKKDQSAVLSEETRLRPLGHPSQGCEKFFLECHISGLEDDPVWLHKALLTIRLYRRLPRKSRNGGETPEDKQNGIDQS